MNMTPLKKSGRRTENEIYVTFDVTIFKILSTPIQKYGVLPAKKTAIAKHSTITVNTNRECLPNWTSAVRKGNVFSHEIVCIDDGGRRTKGSNRFSILANDV